jgi:hypothetical protein
MISSSNKTPAFIFVTYFKVLYEMNSATFLQQLRKVKTSENFEHSKTHTIKCYMFFKHGLYFNYF